MGEPVVTGSDGNHAAQHFRACVGTGLTTASQGWIVGARGLA
jgi:hypothetical protein